ncbi:MAG: hypothetical protein COA49_05685 [Bacteroidetes bacterium]|nr:MAG: hypothetical protein COA49_05685 [Bacteroidota bacterium]
MLNSFSAQTYPTFHEDIAPIIYNNCTECHRQGGLGPMPLVTYNDVFVYGEFIEMVTSTGFMPPWIPDHNYSHFRGERVLSDSLKLVLSDWVTGGKQEGNPAANPGVPIFTNESVLGVPDIALTMSEPWVQAGNMADQYQIFLIPTGVNTTTYVRAIEVITGNSAIAHHSIIGYSSDPVVIAEALAMDAATPEPGYVGFGGFGVALEDNLFGVWVPGSPPTEFPDGIGKLMEPGSYLFLQMHYGPTPVEEVDLTTINIFTADIPVSRVVDVYTLSPINFPEPFIIPADQITSFHATFDIPSDISLVSITPHMHLLGKSWLVYATSADNLDTIPLISIPQWDFHWQGMFTFPSLLKIPAGYTLHAIGEYDNTTSNLDNPFSPPQSMTWGEFTTQEMFIVFAQFVLYQPGDENLTFGGNGGNNACDPAALQAAYDSGYADGIASVVCPEPCPGDINMDGFLTAIDLLGFLSIFGSFCP